MLNPMPPTLAARWITMSEPSSTARAACSTRRSYSLDGGVDTDASRSLSIRHTARPRKPRPPVTVTRLSFQKSGEGFVTSPPSGPLVTVTSDLARELVLERGHVGVDHDPRQLLEADSR